MNGIPDTPGDRRWMRGLYMLLMAIGFNVCVTVLCVVTVAQFVIVLLIGAPNAQLASFGRSMGSYLRQIAVFLAFATEAMPFPFGEWPGGV